MKTTEFQPLTYVYQPAPGAARATLLLLHGTVGDERDLLRLREGYKKLFQIVEHPAFQRITEGVESFVTGEMELTLPPEIVDALDDVSAD